MDAIIKNIQDKLAEISFLHIDEDWGQLDYYSPNPPVKFPCVLLDVASANYSNIGKDNTKTPINRQHGACSLTVKVANLKLTNSSVKAPILQKDAAFSVNGLIQQIHELLHGFNPEANSTGLIRVSRQRVIRDDGIQEYNITYTFELNDV